MAIKSVYQTLKLKKIGEYKKEKILKDITEIGLGNAYSALCAEPRPANIMKCSRWRFLCTEPREEPTIAGYYLPKGHALTSITYPTPKEVLVEYAPKNTIVLLTKLFDKKWILEHEEKHHINKMVTEGFFSSQDDDLIKNTIDYFSNNFASKEAQEMTYLHRNALTLRVFPNTDKLKEITRDTNLIRKHAHKFSRAVFEALPKYQVEGFAIHHTKSSQNTIELLLNLDKIAVYYTLFPHKLARSLAQKAKNHYHKNPNVVKAGEFWKKLTSGLNEKEELLLSAFPMQEASAKEILKKRDEHLKALEEYF